MKWIVCPDYEALSEKGASIFIEQVRRNPKSALGLPTGRTPVGMYDRVVQECTREYSCFREISSFNLDEYVGIPKEHPGSYFSFMKEHLFDHVDIGPASANLPDGMAADLEAECERYESKIRAAGGLDLTFLGLGRNGHIGFNEPGTAFDSRTRVVELHESTRIANATLFEDGHVPAHAITMGIGTILESRRIVLLVSGSGKEDAIARLREGKPDVAFPASALWQHQDVTVLSIG